MQHGQGLSQTGYAKHRKVTQQAVSKQVARGRIQLLPDGTIDPAQADAAWPRRNGQRRRRDDYDPLELERARAEKTRLEAKLRALDLRLREGQLVDRAMVQDRVLAYIRRARDRWLTWPARIGAELADELGIDAIVLIGALEDRVHAQLEAIAEDTLELPGGVAV